MTVIETSSAITSSSQAASGSGERAGGARPSRLSVLMLAQIPPPVHGVTVTSKNILELLRENPDVDVIHDWAGGARSLADIGKPDLSKVWGFLGLMWRLVWRRISGRKVDATYQTIAPLTASLRDSIVVGISKHAGRRALIHLHSEGLEEMLHGPGLRRRLERFLLKDSELIAIGSDIAREAEKSGLFRRAHVLHNSVEDPGVPACAPPDGPITCGFLANFFPVKGVLRFVDVIARLKARGIAVRGRIAGGETRELDVAAIKAYVDKMGVGDIVEVQGYIGGEDKLAFLRSLDFFV